MASLALLRLVRWPGAVTAAGNAAAAFLLAHVPASPGGWGAALGACAGGFLVYAGGVTLNDVADAERDRPLHPGRPLPTGTVSRRAAAWFGSALLVLGAALSAALGGVHAGAATAAAGLFAVLYDFGGRRSRVGGALCLALARGTNAAAGAIAAAGTWTFLADGLSVPLLFPLALAAYTFVLTWISTFEDRTLARWVPGFFAALLAVVAASAWPMFRATGWPAAPAIPLLVLLATFVMAARDAREPDGPGIGLLVRAGVFGFLLVDATWLFGAGRYDAGFWWLLVYVAMRVVLMRARS